MNSKSTDPNKVAYFGVTNLEHATSFPNKDPNFKYHSLMISKLVEIPYNELDNLKWAINGYLSGFVEKLNTTNNSLGIKYDLNHVKLCDCKYDFITPNSINFSGNFYVYDSDKLNQKLNNKLNKLPDDMINEIKGHM